MRLTHAIERILRPRWAARASAAALLALWALLGAPAPADAATPLRTSAISLLAVSRLSDSASLQQCLTAEAQAERSATFAGEMSAIPGTAKMEMRIDVLERAAGDTGYRVLSAPGLGVWRSAAPGVKVYKYLKQVTNLAAPAFYRAAIRFRWLNARGRLIAVTELHTRRCGQPAAVPPAPTSPGMPLE